jgi:hypothetical protein
MSDPRAIVETCAEVCAAVGKADCILVCNSCGNLKAPISGLLVSDGTRKPGRHAEIACAVPLLGAVI